MAWGRGPPPPPQGGRGGGRGRGGGGRDSGGRGRGGGRDSYHQHGRGRGDGRGGRNSGGRGSGGRGGGRGSSQQQQPFPSHALSNLIPCSLTPHFAFHQYNLNIQNSKGTEVESRSRRSSLWNLAMFGEGGYLKRVCKIGGEKELEDWRRALFFQGTYVFAARAIPGLAEKIHDSISGDGNKGGGVVLVGAKSSKESERGIPISDDGEVLIMTGAITLSKPLEMMTVKDRHQIQQQQQTKSTKQQTITSSMEELSLDLRCANCVHTFVDENALFMHCRETGHFPVNDTTISSNSSSGGGSRPAKREEFIQYANVVLQRALGEKLARWGREYIDPKSFTEPADRYGKSLGVRVFKAYSCEFGWNKSKPDPNEPLQLVLTADLRAKVMRTKSLLDVFCGDNSNPESTKFDQRTQSDIKRRWCNEVVIATYDKRCYSVIDFVFDKSPATLPVPDLGMSHAEYFQKRKGIKLQYPNAKPMVVVSGRNNSKIHLPAELVCGNELDPQIKMKLPSIASFTPDVRLEGIEEMKRFLIPSGKTKRAGGGLLTSLGFGLTDELIKVKVTKLELPVISAAGLNVPDRMGGMWAPFISKANYRVNPKHAVELKVVLVGHRTIKNFNSVYDRIRDMVNGHQAKFRLGEKPFSYVQAGDKKDHWGAVEKYFGGTKNKLPNNLMVLDLSRPPRGQSTDPAYHVVKQMLSQGGYVSQFVNFATYDHGNPRDIKKSSLILQGVARQILSKCGVRVWWVNIPRSLPLPAVFVGVDVYHAPRKYDPKAGKRLAKESVAAVIVQIVRSHSPEENTMVEIYCETERRLAGKEMELGSVMSRTVSNALKAFNLPSPKSCFIWRDGVGDNTISQVAAQEIPAVRAALANAGKVVGVAQGTEKSGHVPLAYIICQKRINTKLLTENGSAVPCGALVTDLQGADYRTFYINGTSPPYSTPKPARFVIAERDQQLAKVSPSELSWALCHDYPNWTGPIKLPSPVQMAHKLAELAGGMQDNGESINHEKYAGKIYFL